MTFTFEIKIWLKVTTHLLPTSTLCVKYNLDRYNMVATRCFFLKSDDLEMWFKVTAHSLPRGTMCVKYEPDWDKGRKIMP